MEKKQMQQLIMMMPIVLVALAFGYIKYLLAPLNVKTKQIKSDLQAIKKEYQESEGRAARLPRLEQEIVVLNREITEIEKKLPPNKDVPGLIRLLSKKMNTYGVTWMRLIPGAMVSKEYYIEHMYTIPFRSTYHNLAAFLSEVGQMERIFATRFGKLGTTVDPQTNRTLVNGELTFIIYTSK